MATLGVTIGVGEEHRFYAEQAAARVRFHLGIQTFIIDDRHLPFALDLEYFPKKVWTLKFRIFDIVPTCFDRVMYFDNDWRPVRDWNVDLLFRDRQAIYVVADQTHLDFVQQLEKSYGLEHGTYFNAGWMILPRSARPLLDQARRQYGTLSESYGDQCVLNQILAGKVTYAPRAFNVLDFDSWPDPANIMAVHSIAYKWNYQVYKGETADRNWAVTKFADAYETTLRNLDYSHNRTIAVDHIVELYQSARSFSGGHALELGSRRGHSALALTLAGLTVRSYDTSEEHLPDREGLISRHFRQVDFRTAPGEAELSLDDRFDVVFHDSGCGDNDRPELEAFWDRKVKSGGLFVVRDVHLLNVQSLVDEMKPAEHLVSSDEAGRQMGFFRKS